MSLLGIPIYTLAKYRGMASAVRALRELGLADVLRQRRGSFRDFGDVALPQMQRDSGPSNMRNFQHFSESTGLIYEAASQVPEDDFVFCLGGECGLIVGTLAAFRSKFKGQPGLLWMDAHGDFNTPGTTPSGFLGGMPLAFACGRGPQLSPTIEKARPLITEDQIVHLGSRDLDPPEAKAMEASPMCVYSAAMMHKQGVERVAGDVANYLADRADWIICHLDVDVTDSSVLPAVNYPSRGGLTLKEVKATLTTLMRSEKLKVFNLTAYNPELDRTQTSGRTILKLISDIFA